MFKGMRLGLSLFLVFGGAPAHAASGDEDMGRVENRNSQSVFEKGRISLQLVSGSLFSPTAIAARTKVLDYGQVNLRVARMLTEPSRSHSLLRGNFEAILELSNSVIYKGPGSYMGGLTGLIRYNFVQPHLDLTAYFQTGIGAVYTDAYKDESQDAIGRPIEFTPQASLGFRYLFDLNWSLDAEIMFHHVSNAGLSERNDGINALGGFIGLTYYFNNPPPEGSGSHLRLHMDGLICEDITAGKSITESSPALSQDVFGKTFNPASPGSPTRTGMQRRTASVQLVWKAENDRGTDQRSGTETAQSCRHLQRGVGSSAWLKGGLVTIRPELDRASCPRLPSAEQSTLQLEAKTSLH